MRRQRFRARLDPVRPDGTGGAFITIGPDVAAALGRKARTPVRGTINGFPFRSSIFPRGDSSFSMVLNRALREAASVKVGEVLDVVMEVDQAPREVDVPEDFRRALGRSRAARAAFEGLPYSHRKKDVDWITEARPDDTRRRRIERAVEMLTAGARLD